MSQNILFQTADNVWDKTVLLDMNQPAEANRQISASRLYVHLTTAVDEYDNPIPGIGEVGTLEAFLCPIDNPLVGDGFLPGRLELDIVHAEFGDHNVVIENFSPIAEWADTRVWYNGIEVTDSIVELFYDVNPELDNPNSQGYIQGYIRLYKGRLLGNDEIITFTLGS